MKANENRRCECAMKVAPQDAPEGQEGGQADE